MEKAEKILWWHSDWSQAASGEPLSPQQHAVVVALIVVIKRALLEGHDAASVARQRLLCNNWDTFVVLQLHQRRKGSSQH